MMNTPNLKIQRMLMFVWFAAALIMGYNSLAFSVWQWRNPKANAMTLYSHYWDVVTWKKLAQFQ